MVETNANADEYATRYVERPNPMVRNLLQHPCRTLLTFHTRPELRDVMIQQPDKFDELYDALPSFASVLAINWPHSPADLIDCDPETNVITLSPLFERQALDLKNWSLQPGAMSCYPALVDYVNAGCE